MEEKANGEKVKIGMIVGTIRGGMSVSIDINFSLCRSFEATLLSC